MNWCSGPRPLRWSLCWPNDTALRSESGMADVACQSVLAPNVAMVLREHSSEATKPRLGSTPE